MLATGKAHPFRFHSQKLCLFISLFRIRYGKCFQSFTTNCVWGFFKCRLLSAFTSDRFELPVQQSKRLGPCCGFYHCCKSRAACFYLVHFIGGPLSRRCMAKFRTAWNLSFCAASLNKNQTLLPGWCFLQGPSVPPYDHRKAGRCGTENILAVCFCTQGRKATAARHQNSPTVAGPPFWS